MKVQRKCDPFKTWEVIEESPNHYIVSDGSPRGEGLAYCLPKADYEPVPEWVDVTQDCRLGKYSGFAKEGLEGWGYIAVGTHGSLTHPEHWNKKFKADITPTGIRVYMKKEAQ